ncbi:MAG: ribonucleoside-triphosphate reductase activating protein, partial [Sphingobacteriales bacterium]
SGTGDRIEIRVSKAGDVAINGWANVDALDELLAGTTQPVGRGSVR